jgi:hypothetical protein
MACAGLRKIPAKLFTALFLGGVDWSRRKKLGLSQISLTTPIPTYLAPQDTNTSTLDGRRTLTQYTV